MKKPVTGALILLILSVFLLFIPVSVFAAVPGAPTIGPTSAGSGQVTVNFTPPVSDGGSPILDYTVTSSPDGLTATAGESPITLTGLTNGRVYTFTVTARNSDGPSGPSGPSYNTTPRLYAPTGTLANPVTINNLVVFIRFSDQPAFNQPLSYYDAIFNAAGNSLKSLYLENSYGALTVTSTFYPLPMGEYSDPVLSYQDSNPVSYYQGAGAAEREKALVTGALNSVSADIIASGLNLDADNDGYIDHITFEVYSSSLHPQPVSFNSRATYDTTNSIEMNGLKVGSYTWVTAVQDSSYPANSFASVEIHEMGHNLGYPDLRNNFNGFDPVGNWDIMSLSFSTVHSGAYMKNTFTHWIPAIPEITSALYGTYTINDITQPTNNSYKITLPNTKEFLVLEYRPAVGTFESHLPGKGLCITRVNEAAGIWGNMNGPPFFLYYFRPGGTLLDDGSAANLFTCLDAASGQTQFNDYSNPACFLSDGTPCGISIYDIGAATGPSISFSLGDPATTIVTHTISGYLYNGGNRVSGASVTLSGEAANATTTDSLGRYLFTVNRGGSYTVTPAKANLTFTPSVRTFLSVTGDQVQNFSAANNTNTISGTISSSGASLGGVAVYCNCTAGGNYTSPVTTGADGTYSFTVNAGGDCQIYAIKANYFFSPASKTFTNISQDQVQNFTTWTATVNLTGTVTYNGSPLIGIDVSCPGAATPTPVITDATGGYFFTVTVGAGAEYTVTPSSASYIFTPAGRTYTGLFSSQVQDFAGTAAAYTLLITRVGSGTVLADSNPVTWTDETYSSPYNAGVSVGLLAVPDLCYAFDTWGGDYLSQIADALLLMNRDWNLTVSFRVNLPVYNATGQKDYPTIAAANLSIADGDSIRLQAGSFDESLQLDRSGVSITGGVDCDYQLQDAATTINQLIIGSGGSAVVDRIMLQ
ncbi:MAG: hypothetical protein C0402_14625 [Thermodesulfovibrio sp.]|nr:hypothetical protein [Thermodesulfovibrio sp.]